MLNHRYFSMVILFLSVFIVQPTSSHAQDILSDTWWDVPQTYMTYSVIESSLLIQTPDGFLYRVSKMNAEDEYSLYMADSPSFDVRQIYWGESYIEAALGKIGEMWGEVKAYVILILEKVKDVMSILGMLLIFLLSGVLTYFVNTAVPAFSPKLTFYSVFTLLCIGWVYLTSVWSSVIYASAILMIPHLIIALLGLAYRRIQQRFGKDKPA